MPLIEAMNAAEVGVSLMVGDSNEGMKNMRRFFEGARSRGSIPGLEIGGISRTEQLLWGLRHDKSKPWESTF